MPEPESKSDANQSALEVRVRKLETYWYVTLTLAAILGIGGSWLQTRLSQLESESRQLLLSVQQAKQAAVSDIEASRNNALSATAALANTEASKQVTAFLGHRLIGGVTAVGALNGHNEHLDYTIPFKDKSGKDIQFDSVPRVMAIVDRQSAEDDVAWSVNLLGVTKNGFSIRVRSTDQHREHNPGWNGALGVQWIAYAENKEP
jgi:hypothetical protein